MISAIGLLIWVQNAVAKLRALPTMGGFWVLAKHHFTERKWLSPRSHY
jgi:hypothetical protein